MPTGKKVERSAEDKTAQQQLTISSRIANSAMESQQKFADPLVKLHESARVFLQSQGFNFEGDFYETHDKEVIPFEIAHPDSAKKQINCWLKCVYPERKTGEQGLCITFGAFHPSRAQHDTRTFWSDVKFALTDEEKAAVQEILVMGRQKAEERAKEEKKIADAKADWCIEKLKNASPDGSSPYFERNGVKPSNIYFEKRKTYADDGSFTEDTIALIPLRNISGKIRSLQEIYPSKRTFGDDLKPRDKNTYGSYSGCFFTFGKLEDGQPINIGEGYNTAKSIFDSTNATSLMAVSRVNIANVVKAIKQKFPKSQITVCADSDPDGLKDAAEAARKYKCRLAVPKFPGEKGGKDFNDLMLTDGKEEVKRQINLATLPEEDDEQEWEDPKPIMAELHPVEPFNADELLPAPLRDFVVDEADRMPCPQDFVAAALIVTLGAVLGSQCAVRPKKYDSWIVVPNLWGGVVGLPSAKKSPAIDAAQKPLDRVIAEYRKRFDYDLVDFQDQQLLFEAKKEAVEKGIKDSAKNKKDKSETPEQLLKKLKEIRQDCPTPPIFRRFKTNDSTVEKLGELLRENPSGMLVLRDELVGLLASWDRAGREGDRAFFLEAWNGSSSFDTDRIGRGSIHVPNLCLSLFGGVQPDKLTHYLDLTSNSLENDGMLQRFQILVYPDPIRWEWRDRSPDKAARDLVYRIFSMITSDEFDPIAWGAEKGELDKFPYFHFDQEAQELFIEWSKSLQEKIAAEDNPILQQHFAKYEKLFAGLSLIFHLVDCAFGEESGSIKISSARRAAAWSQYLESHARRCYGLLGDRGLRAAQALSAKLLHGKLLDGFTARDVYRNGWTFLKEQTAAASACEWLEAENWLRSYPVGGTGPGTGQPTMRYKINSKIFDSKYTLNQEGEVASG